RTSPRLRIWVAADFDLAVDDNAATFGHIREDPNVVRVPVPGPCTRILEYPLFHFVGRKHFESVPPHGRLGHLYDARAACAVTTEHRQRLPDAVDGDIVPRVILEVAMTADHHE